MRRVSKAVLTSGVVLLTALLTGCVVSPPSNVQPTACFEYDPPNPKVGKPVTFDASCSSDVEGLALSPQSIVSYDWDFGDGETGGGVVVTHTYTQPGDFLVRLVVTDDNGATAEAQEWITVTLECDVTHEGDLEIDSGKIFEITDNTVFCQEGNILIESGSQMVVNNGVLVVIMSYDQQYEFRVYGRIEFVDATLLANTGFVGMRVWGEADISTSTLQSWPEGNGNCTIRIADSIIKGVALHQMADISVSNSTILDHVDIDTMYTANASITISDLHPGFIDYWNAHEDMTIEGSFGDLTLENTYVNMWIVRAGGENTVIEIRDSEIGWLRLGHFHEPGSHWPGGPTLVINSNIGWFFCGDYEGGPITFEGVSINRFSIQYASLEMIGTVTFADSAASWESATVTRTYPVIVRDALESPVPSVDLELACPDGQVWSGKTDSDGKATFEIVFDDDNFTMMCSLNAPSLSVQREVRLLTDTPIVITA